jgi:hypothetical protein
VQIWEIVTITPSPLTALRARFLSLFLDLDFKLYVYRTVA